MRVEDVPDKAIIVLKDAPIAVKEIITTAIQIKSSWESAEIYIGDKLDELLVGAQEALEELCVKRVWLERDY